MSVYSLIIAQHPQETRDYRSGPLRIDWIDYHGEKEIPQQQQDVPAKPVKDVKPNTDVDSPPRRFTQGTTSLGPGIVHLFRHASLPLSLPEAGTAAEGEDGTLVAVLAVPLWMGFHEFGEWLGAWRMRLEGFRMIRDASPNKTLVLLKFQEQTAANDFISIHTGTTFSRNPGRGETCQPIRIHHLKLHDVPSASPTALLELLDVTRESTYELPTCPVCLERMDAVVTGLVTSPCTHTGDCQCLARWTTPGTETCPVCRIAVRAAPAAGTRCMACPAEEPTRRDGEEEGHSNWVCTVCAYLGCSRYEAGHARDHWTETGHAFSMEIETGRVWNYIEDNYVHRLIQNKSDGKLVELPSATLSTRLNSLNLTPGRGPTASDEKWVTSLERATAESQRLAGQLAEREAAFVREREKMDDQVRGMKEEVASWREKWQVSERRIKELQESMADLERAKTTAEKKAKVATTLSQTLRKDLTSEKSLTTGLLTKIRTLETTLAETTEREKATEERIKEMEETMGDLMASISMGERVKENGGEGGDLGVTQKKKKGKR
ncbi:hypothetical protein NCC49_006396 [Naganishia albida]|nr:hypothetical protein NCC49_006396 [Naganishia albida]